MTHYNDTLKLTGNSNVQKMLAKNGDKTSPEEVQFSDFLVKINKKGKEQTRALLITDKAVYNLMPNDFKKCKRRIKLENIGSISVSQTSDEFVVHVPEEYDYRFKSSKKIAIADCIARVVSQRFNKRVKKINRQQETLKGIAMTKKEARLQTREQRRQRYEQLLREGGESDDEDMDSKAAHNNDVSVQSMRCFPPRNAGGGGGGVLFFLSGTEPCRVFKFVCTCVGGEVHRFRNVLDGRRWMWEWVWVVNVISSKVL